MNFDKEKKKLMQSKNPEQYIENSWNSQLTPGQKSAITQEWLRSKKFTIEDIQYARNRNKHWKKLKNQGNMERNSLRIAKYDFSKNNSSKKIWKKEDLEEFFKLNSKMADWELAKKFKTSLPSINHIRRKFKIAEALLAKKREKLTAKKIINLAMINENSLRSEILGSAKPKKVKAEKFVAAKVNNNNIGPNVLLARK